MSKALIVVDVQYDFCPGGSLAVAGGDEVASRITDWLTKHSQEYASVVATQDWHPNNELFSHFSDHPDYHYTWPPHCVRDTHGAELHGNLSWTFPVVFKKGQIDAAYSGFEGTNQFNESLNSYLHDRLIEEVDVVGIATDYCVYATAMDAAKHGYQTTVLLDLTAAVNPDSIPRISLELIDAGVAVADALL